MASSLLQMDWNYSFTLVFSRIDTLCLLSILVYVKDDFIRSFCFRNMYLQFQRISSSSASVCVASCDWTVFPHLTSACFLKYFFDLWPPFSERSAKLSFAVVVVVVVDRRKLCPYTLTSKTYVTPKSCVCWHILHTSHTHTTHSLCLTCMCGSCRILQAAGCWRSSLQSYRREGKVSSQSSQVLSTWSAWDRQTSARWEKVRGQARGRCVPHPQYERSSPGWARAAQQLWLPAPSSVGASRVPPCSPPVPFSWPEVWMARAPGNLPDLHTTR